jgi:hypothetical protein
MSGCDVNSYGYFLATRMRKIICIKTDAPANSQRRRYALKAWRVYARQAPRLKSGDQIKAILDDLIYLSCTAVRCENLASMSTFIANGSKEVKQNPLNTGQVKMANCIGNTALKTYQTHRAKVLPSRCLSVAQRLGAG